MVQQANHKQFVAALKEIADPAAVAGVARYFWTDPNGHSAIVSTYYFIRSGDLYDTFGIAEILVNDKHELVQKAVRSWTREAGKKDPKRLASFLRNADKRR